MHLQLVTTLRTFGNNTPPKRTVAFGFRYVSTSDSNTRNPLAKALSDSRSKLRSTPELFVEEILRLETCL